MFRMDFRLDQATQGWVSWMALVPGELALAVQRTKGRMAESCAKRVVNRILGQRYDHKELSPGWVQSKAFRRKDPRILVESEAYVNSIKGNPDGSVEGDKDKAIWHEYGTRRIPARPHWTPVLAELGRQAPDWLQEEVLRVLAGR